MPRALKARIDEALPQGSYSFLVLELAFRNEADVPGLLRYKLETVLPRGLEGLRYYYRRIGKTRRFIVTLAKEPLPAAFAPERTRLPFALSLSDKRRAQIEWTTNSVSYLSRYEEGILVSVEARSSTDGRSNSNEDFSSERREALQGGLAMHRNTGNAELVWRIAAWALALGLAAQLAILAAGNISSREVRLAALEEQIAILSRNAPAEGDRPTEDATIGLQSRADEIFRSVSSRWKSGYFLTKWSLKGGRLRLEGWGPDALRLLSSLRGDPVLAGLELASRKDEGGYELFAFEGMADND